MRRIIALILCLAGGTIAGLGSARWAVEHSSEKIRNGAWSTDLSTGGGDANLWRRAQTAVHGIWALKSTEVIYYTASFDSAGKPLRQACTYRIEGAPADARWWSVTAYINDHFIANPLNRYSFSQTTVKRRADQSWLIHASAKKTGENWLPTGETDGKLVFTFRCYNPGDAMRAKPEAAKVPTITEESCQ